MNQEQATVPPLLYENPACIVVNKRCGDAMEGATPSVVDLPALLAATWGVGRNRDGKPFPPTAVHRLDVPVTGCALFARTPQALAFLNDAFAQSLARKVYWAIVEKPDSSIPALESQGELVHWISVDSRHNKSYAHTEERSDRKRAVLRYRVIGQGDHYLFLEIGLITGRHHQIRAQLAALGLHIKGDLKYGSRRSEKNGGIRLHARSLAFPDPLSDITDPAKRPLIQVVAPLIEPDRLWQDFERAAQV
ncbi:MAG TPA: RNA pseudouridine synthase [Treponema sp.]|nr:RNA pseudouridine synthase [Treponema sp.]